MTTTPLEERLAAALHARADQVTPDLLRPLPVASLEARRRRSAPAWLVAAAATVLLAGGTALSWALLQDDDADEDLPPLEQPTSYAEPTELDRLVTQLDEDATEDTAVLMAEGTTRTLTIAFSGRHGEVTVDVPDTTVGLERMTLSRQSYWPAVLLVPEDGETAAIAAVGFDAGQPPLAVHQPTGDAPPLREGTLADGREVHYGVFGDLLWSWAVEPGATGTVPVDAWFWEVWDDRPQPRLNPDFLGSAPAGATLDWCWDAGGDEGPVECNPR